MSGLEYRGTASLCVNHLSSLGYSRFLKTVKCKHRNGHLVIKIFIKPDPGLSLRIYARNSVTVDVPVLVCATQDKSHIEDKLATFGAQQLVVIRTQFAIVMSTHLWSSVTGFHS